MSLPFSPANIVAITRRQININLEIAAYRSSIAQLMADQARFLAVDQANQVFYDYYSNQATQYEQEAQAINGTISAVYTEGSVSPYVSGDLVDSAMNGIGFFYPSSPTYTYLIPYIAPAVNGYLHPTGTAPVYELNVMSNPSGNDGLVESINFLVNGISSGAPYIASGSTPVPAGPVTNLSLTVSTVGTIAAGQIVYIYDGTSSGIYIVVGTGSLTITVSSITPATSSMSSSISISNSEPGFTNSERQNLSTGGSFQMILTNLAAQILSLVNEWNTELTVQLTALGLQQDSRSLQTSQNSTAITNATSAQAQVNTWLAFPVTGLTGRYSNTSLLTLTNEIGIRQTYLPTRITQIVTALGYASQTGNTYTGVTNSTYLNRYTWLDIRISKSSGSATRYFSSNNGIMYITQLLNDDLMLQAEYNMYFRTSPITFFNQQTTVVQVDTNVGFSSGDQVYVLSDTQPSVLYSIVQLLGTTQLQLNTIIPPTYTQADLVRIYKELQ
jgi:hypothetical protein